MNIFVRIMTVAVTAILSLSSMTAGGQTVQVIVSVIPQKHFVKKIGGNRVEVSSMVTPNHNPELYEPTPRQMEEVSSAQIYLTIGVPYEDRWLQPIRKAHPHLRIVDGSEGVQLIANESHHDDDDDHDDHNDHDGHDDHDDHEMHEEETSHHDHGAFDRHIWTSPAIVQKMIGIIRDALITVDPEGADVYRRNYAHYYDQLGQLDKQLRRILADVRGRKFIIFHPAWGYFAQRYGLEQVAIEYQGKEPSTQQLSNLVRSIEQLPTRTVFYQPQFPVTIAQRVADSIGGTAVSIDPLAENYESNLLYVARQLHMALQ